MNLLIADDEIFIRQGLLSLDWKSVGINEVYSATNGAEVENLLLSTSIDLAILDIKMPGMTGLQIAELVKANSLDTIIIFLTGFADFEYARQAIRCNVYEYILKPFRPREILEVVSRAKRYAEQKRFQTKAVQEYEKDQARPEDYDQIHNYFSKISGITEKVLEEIAEHYAEQLTLEEIADRYHFSVAYLSRKIKQDAGSSFLDILKAVRLWHAANMLYEGERINNTAAKTGFRDQHYFSQVFRSAFDISPSEFRKVCQEENINIKFYSIMHRVTKKKEAENEE